MTYAADFVIDLGTGWQEIVIKITLKEDQTDAVKQLLTAIQFIITLACFIFINI